MSKKSAKPVMDSSKYVHGKWGTQDVSYNTRDLLIYAVGIGCAKESRTGHDSNHSDIKFIYEKDKNFAAFPTYPVLLTQKGHTQDIDTNASADYYLNLLKPRDPNSAAAKDVFQIPIFPGIRASVDAGRYIERVRTLPAGVKDKIPPKMTVRRRLIGVHKKGSGALIEHESELIDESGQVYYKFTTGDFMIGAYGFTDAGVTVAEKIKPPQRDPDDVVELETTPEQAHMYRLSSDYNPLHVSPGFAKPSGFPAPILHGLCTLGHSARAVLQAMGGNDPTRFHAIKLTFSSPVIPGDTLVTKMWKLPKSEAQKLIKYPLKEGTERIVFTTEVKSSKKVVLANAFMDVFTAQAKAKL